MSFYLKFRSDETLVVVLDEKTKLTIDYLCSDYIENKSKTKLLGLD